MYTLEIIAGESPVSNVHIDSEVIVAGTQARCDIQLEGDDIAEKHLALEMKQGQLKAYDLTQGNDVKLNGVSIHSAEVHHEDIIDLGLYRMKVLLDNARPAIPALPMGTKRPWGLMQCASILSVVLMLIMQMVFIFFFSMRWRNSEIQFEAKPVIQLAQGTPPASPVKKTPRPETPASESITPAVEERTGPGRPTAKPAPTQETTIEPATTEPETPKAAPPPPPATVPPRTEPEPSPPPQPPAAATPQPVPLKPAPPKPTPDPLAREKKMLAEARELVKKQDWIGADLLLSALQKANPRFLDAYAERAVVLERKGELAAAVRQWEEVAARGPRHPKFKEALKARDRLQETIKLAAAPRPAPKPPPVTPKKEVPVEPSERKIYISSVEIQRYDKNERFDEMRLLTIELKPRSASQRLAGPDITVQVAFYDQDEKSGSVVPTKALVPESLFQLSGRVRLSEPPNLNAAYVVPKGFRKKQEATTKRDMRFYGYRIQLYYKGKLQHQVSKPDSLLSVMP